MSHEPGLVSFSDEWMTTSFAQEVIDFGYRVLLLFVK